MFDRGIRGNRRGLSKARRKPKKPFDKPRNSGLFLAHALLRCTQAYYYGTKAIGDGQSKSSMITQADIQKMADIIVERFQPEKIILFGSCARGDATL